MRGQTDRLLVDFRNYFSIITGIVGIILGGFYYSHRLIKDHENKRNEIFKRRLNILFEQLCVYDDLVDSLLNKQFDNSSELVYLRNKISKSFEIVELLLKQNKDELHLDQEELDILLEVNSFVDNSETIMSTKYTKIKSMNLSEAKDLYVEKIKAAKQISFMKAILEN